MNFCIIRGNELVTPPLFGTILVGVTRDSLLQLAPSLGLKPSERPIRNDQLAADIGSGAVSEVFLCGTAAIIASIGSLKFESGKVLTIGSNGATPIADKLRDTLLDIQFGTIAGPDGWVVSTR